METSKNKIELIHQLIKLAKREHYNCEMDTWYGCPLSKDGCSDDNVLHVCNCGTNEHNKEVEKVAGELLEEMKWILKNFN